MAVEAEHIYFWRRLFAIVIDYLIVAVCVSILYLPFMWMSNGTLVFYGDPFELTRETVQDRDISAPYAKYFPDIDGYEQYEVMVERYAWFVIPNGRYVKLVSEKNENLSLNKNLSLNMEIPVDHEGNLAKMGSFDQILFLFVWVFVTPFVRARRYTSLGKRMMALDLQAWPKREMGYAAFLKRELVRSSGFIIPMLILVFFLLSFQFIDQDAFMMSLKADIEAYAQTGSLADLDGNIIGYSFGVTLLVTLCFLIYIAVILYCVFRKMRMPWDRVAGTVVRA